MPIGVIADALAVAVGGLLGTLLSDRIPERLKENLNMIFGICVMGMGIKSIIVLHSLPAVIMSLIVGSAVGICLNLEERLQNRLRSLVSAGEGRGEMLTGLITVIVLFCASANGIYGSLESGFSNDHTILISKAIMDLFTALIFACTYGKLITLIAVPQFIIYAAVFFLARFIFPLTTETMILDFKGCGGLLMLATGFRVMKVRQFPLVDMIPAMIVVMPLSYLVSLF